MQAFLEFCYIVRRNIHDETTLSNLEDALDRFHHFRTIFQKCGVRPQGFSLPRQHSLVHYFSLIRLFGAPNGLCSSITESKHIKAVKEPWRRSNHFEAIMQMMVTNQRLDKLWAMRVDFTRRGMLEGSLGILLSYAHKDFQLINILALQDRRPNPESVPATNPEEDAEGDGDGAADGPAVLGHVKLARKPGTLQHFTMPSAFPQLKDLSFPARGYPRNLAVLGQHLKFPELHDLVRRFLYDRMHPDAPGNAATTPLEHCPQFEGPVSIFHSAIALYYAPSDPSGSGGMHKERICATPRWRGGYPRYDCVFILNDPSLPGFRALLAARVRLLFSFQHHGIFYPCALVSWFSSVSEAPDEDTGMWIVAPTLDQRGKEVRSVIHLDCIVRGAHLLAVAGKDFLPLHFHFSDTLDAFSSFYVNKFADHHAFEIAF